MSKFISIEALYTVFIQQNQSISTDTRKLDNGTIFFALKGGNFNGNTFAEKALEQGAAYVVVDEEEYKLNERCLLVSDVLTALQQLALYHRRKLGIPILSITGSNGKTTSKELIASVLSQKFNLFATKGNLNNHIGIPLTLLSILPSHQFAIVEMGANHQKEIESYCLYTEPNFGYITNIGKAHLEGFGGIEGVKKGKGELFQYLLHNKGNVFVNSSNPVLMDLAKGFEYPILFSKEDELTYGKIVESNPFLIVSIENAIQINTHLVGAYNLDNILAATCIGKYFGLTLEEIKTGIESYKPDNNRSQFVKKGSNTFILDAYNANPSSMSEAIKNFATIDATNKVLLVGDMFELGDESKVEHERIGELIASFSFTNVLLIGNHMKHAAEKCTHAKYFSDKAQASEYLQKNPIMHSFILIKGSRGMGLESLLPLLDC
jgi:UDP-N-acetylmuramoyl-tripeptide--D-alanyl-D-alanine ligase